MVIDEIEQETVTLTDAQTRCLRRLHRLRAAGTTSIALGSKDARANTLRALAQYGVVEVVKKSKGALYVATPLGVDLLDALFG